MSRKIVQFFKNFYGSGARKGITASKTLSTASLRGGIPATNTSIRTAIIKTYSKAVYPSVLVINFFIFSSLPYNKINTLIL